MIVIRSVDVVLDWRISVIWLCYSSLVFTLFALMNHGLRHLDTNTHLETLYSPKLKNSKLISSTNPGASFCVTSRLGPSWWQEKPIKIAVVFKISRPLYRFPPTLKKLKTLPATCYRIGTYLIALNFSHILHNIQDLLYCTGVSVSILELF